MLNMLDAKLSRPVVRFGAIARHQPVQGGGIATTYEDVILLGGARTPFAKNGGSFKDVSAYDLLKTAMKGTLEKTGVNPADVNQLIMGNVIANDEQKGFLHRQVALGLGMKEGSIASEANRLCGTGFEVLRLAANELVNGGDSVILTGGVENMSRTPALDNRLMQDGMDLLKTANQGALGKLKALVGKRKLNKRTPQTLNPLQKGLTDPANNMVMYQTADKLAKVKGISKQEAEAFSAESQIRAAMARDAGRFADEIVPVRQADLENGRLPEGVAEVATDEHLRLKPGQVSDANRGAMKDSLVGKMKRLAVLDANSEDALHTAATSSGVVDGAAALAVSTGKFAAEKHLPVLAKLKSVAVTGCDPSIMGMGPARAIPAALKAAGLTLDQVDLVEVNEAFAGQVLAVAKELDISEDKLNVDGGAIALGHPLAASGTRITLHAANRLKAEGKRYAVVSACIGGGQGIAAVIENPDAPVLPANWCGTFPNSVKKAQEQG